MSNQNPQWFLQSINETVRLQTLRHFFLMGCQKSGTTWLQHLCDAHPELACSGEGHFSNALIPCLVDGISRYNNIPKTDYRFESTDMAAVIRFAIEQMMLKYLPKDPGQRQAIKAIGDKTPETAGFVSNLYQLYPEARFIQIIRDPRDAVVSGWAHLTRQGKQAKFSSFADYVAFFTNEHWVTYITQARAAAAHIPGRYTEVRYEQMKSDGIQTAKHIFDFLDVSTSDPIVSACIEASSFETLSGGRQPGEEQADSHFRKGLAGDWVNHFDSNSYEVFLTYGGKLAGELGYDLAFPSD